MTGFHVNLERLEEIARLHLAQISENVGRMAGLVRGADVDPGGKVGLINRPPRAAPTAFGHGFGMAGVAQAYDELSEEIFRRLMLLQESVLSSSDVLRATVQLYRDADDPKNSGLHRG